MSKSSINIIFNRQILLQEEGLSPNPLRRLNTGSASTTLTPNSHKYGKKYRSLVIKQMGLLGDRIQRRISAIKKKTSCT